MNNRWIRKQSWHKQRPAWERMERRRCRGGGIYEWRYRLDTEQNHCTSPTTHHEPHTKTKTTAGSSLTMNSTPKIKDCRILDHSPPSSWTAIPRCSTPRRQWLGRTPGGRGGSPDRCEGKSPHPASSRVPAAPRRAWWRWTWNLNRRERSGRCRGSKTCWAANFRWTSNEKKIVWVERKWKGRGREKRGKRKRKGKNNWKWR